MPEKPSGQPVSVRIPDGVTSPSYILHNAAKLYGNRVAMIDGSTGRRLLYSNLVSGVRRLASALYRRGVKSENEDSSTGGTPYPRTPVVCVYGENSLEIPLIVHAVLVLGGTITMADPELSTDDLFHQFQVLPPDYIVADREKIDDAKFAATRIGNVKEIFVLGNHLRGHVTISEMLTDDGRAVPNDIKINCKDDVTIVTFVNDVRGEPKGVMHSHHSFNSNVAILSCRSLSPVTLNDVLMCCHPMWSMVGLVFYCGVAIKEGVTMVIQPTYNPANILAAMVQNKVTVAHTNTHMAEYLSHEPEVTTADLNCLHRVYNSGAPVREGVIGEVIMRTGITEFREGFCIDEVCGACAMPQGETLPGYAGKMCPSTEIKLLDIIFGGVVEPDTYGEICVRGPHVMLGYLPAGSTGQEAVDEDGWMHTGYLGSVDTSGLFTLYGKKDDLIECNENFISPVELERVIRQHYAVDDVAVVGVPCRDIGHVPRAYVVRKPTADIIEGDIYDHVTELLPKDKKLKGGVLFLPCLPKSSYGEVLRYNLRADAARSFLNDLGGEDLDPEESFINLDDSDGEIYGRKQDKEENEGNSENDDTTTEAAPEWQEGKFKEEDFEDFGVDFLHFSNLDCTAPELDAPIISFAEGLDGFITTRDRNDGDSDNRGRKSREEADRYSFSEVFGTDDNNNTETEPLVDITEEDEEEREEEVAVEEVKEKVEELPVQEGDDKDDVREDTEKEENEINDQGRPIQQYEKTPEVIGNYVGNSGQGNEFKKDESSIAEPEISINISNENEAGVYQRSKWDRMSAAHPGIQELINDMVTNYQPPLRTSTPVPDSEMVVADIDITTPVKVDDLTKIDRSTNPVEETEVFTLSEIYDEPDSFIEADTDDYFPEETRDDPRPYGMYIGINNQPRRDVLKGHQRKPAVKLVRDPETGALVVQKVPENNENVDDGHRLGAHRYNTRQNVKIIDRMMTPPKGAKVEVSPTHYSKNGYGHYVSTKNLNVMPKYESSFTTDVAEENKGRLRHVKSTPDLANKKKNLSASNISDGLSGSVEIAAKEVVKPITSNLGEFRPNLSRSIHDIERHVLGGSADVGEIQTFGAGSLDGIGDTNTSPSDRRGSKVKRFFRRFISQEKF